MTRDNTPLESITLLDPDAWKMPVGAKMTIKQPEYECPTHGTITSTITFNRVTDGSVRHFCMECCLEKIVGLGVSEVTEKKP